jgi:glycine/D-amino acid oxidase-like deaminating enzyme
LPLENNTFKIGATYEWDDGSLNTTKEARELLLENFSVISDLPIKVIDQVAGIRPTVLDRRPVLGQHKIHKKLFIFNVYLLANIVGTFYCESICYSITWRV